MPGKRWAAFFPKKKSLEPLALRIAPSFTWSSDGNVSASSRAAFPQDQAGLLAHGSTERLHLPDDSMSPVAFRRLRPRSQRRDRSRFSRDSLLSSKHLIA